MHPSTAPAPGLLALLALIALLGAPTARATGLLENPAEGAGFVSGVGLVSGWHCSATRIEIEIDAGARTPAAAGTDRLDTAAACGRRDTGFGLLLNWAVLGAGTHTVRALADGVEFGRRTVTVVELGAQFLTGKSAGVTVHDFPSPGQSLLLEWQEGLQAFVARERRTGAASLSGAWNGANLERRSGCASAQNDGTRGTYAQYTITADTVGDSFRIQQAAITGLACTYSGTHRLVGNARQASGTLTCSDGKQGSFETRAMDVSANAMSIRMQVKLTGSETCDVDAILGGSRF